MLRVEDPKLVMRFSSRQLFINFTNELLQQYFNEVIFEHEADLYRSAS